MFCQSKQSSSLEERKCSIIKRLLQTIAFTALATLFLAACAPALTPTPILTVVASPTPQAIETEPLSPQAQVQSVEIKITGAAPAQVSAVVRGMLSESCATLGESQVEYAANTFEITVSAVSRPEAGCAQTTLPFEITVPLSVSELTAGTYTVIANGVSAAFNPPVTSPTVIPNQTAAPVSQACTDQAAFVADV